MQFIFELSSISTFGIIFYKHIEIHLNYSKWRIGCSFSKTPTQQYLCRLLHVKKQNTKICKVSSSRYLIEGCQGHTINKFMYTIVQTVVSPTRRLLFMYTSCCFFLLFIFHSFSKLHR